MGKVLLATLVLLAMASPAFAQSTAVTATVRDSSNIPYSFATVAAQLVPTGTAPTINGQQVSATAFTQADINGVISFNLWDNTLIVPGGSQWQITVCETPGVQPPLGTGSQCFPITVTISGASQSLTVQMVAAAPALTNLQTLGNFANRALSNLTAPTAVNAALLGTDGTVAAPAYSFTSSPSTGMFLLAGAQIVFSRLGVSQFSTNGGPGLTSSGTLCVSSATRCFAPKTLPTSLDPGIAVTGGAVGFQWPLVAGNPATAGWGAPEKGNTFFNTVSNLPRYWNGAALVDFGAAGAGSNQQVTYNNGGTAAGALGMLWDNVNNRLGVLLLAGQTIDPWYIEDSGFGLKASFKPDGGLYAPYFNAGLSTGGVLTSHTGGVRFAKTDFLGFRNNLDGADISGVALNTVDQTVLGGAAGIASPTNCADSAGPAACGSAYAGAVVVDAAATAVVVSTTAVTANSEIFLQYDSSLGTRLGVTCNVTVALPTVTARTAGASFTITVPAAPIVNPACYSYHIVN